MSTVRAVFGTFGAQKRALVEEIHGASPTREWEGEIKMGMGSGNAPLLFCTDLKKGYCDIACINAPCLS
jgi:hypothetical protein